MPHSVGKVYLRCQYIFQEIAHSQPTAFFASLLFIPLQLQPKPTTHKTELWLIVQCELAGLISQSEQSGLNIPIQESARLAYCCSI
jgi:hypothetical protein